MSKSIRLTVLCPYGRREVISLSPNSSVLQILEEACKKQNINPDDFDLCHHNKPLDLSLPVRFANLPNNAQLELQPSKSVRKDCLVTVGLKLESGECITKDFKPSTPLLDVMEQCLQMRSNQMNTDSRGEPVCIYMHQQITGEALKSMTLRSLGLIKGSVMIRLMYRKPENLSIESNVTSPLNTRSEDALVVPVNISSNTCNDDDKTSCDLEFVNLPELTTATATVPKEENTSSLSTKNLNPSFKNEEEIMNFQANNLDVHESLISKHSVEVTTNMQDNEIEMAMDQSHDNSFMEVDDHKKDIGAIHYIGKRHAVLYSLDDITEVKKADFPDEFYDITIEDVKYLLSEYKRTRHELENQPLLTKELRKQKLLQKMGAYKQTVIRINFPERLVLQGIFQVSETVQDICEFVKDFLEDKSLNFYLYTTPPKEKKDPSKSLIELLLIPAAVLYFGCDSHHKSYLLGSLKNKISDPQAASLAAYDSRKRSQPSEFSDDNPEVTEETNFLTSAEEETQSQNEQESCLQPTHFAKTEDKKIPKWFKLGGK